MGVNRSSHEEAIFFLRHNQKIFQVAHANWDVPKPIEYLLACTDIRRCLVESLLDEISSLKIINYLGFRRFLRFGGLKGINHSWGWKDPRNLYTLPLWLDIFVDAKVIYIRRNGIDVASSLWKREKERRNKLDNPLVSCRCRTLEGAFELWAEYEDKGLQHIAEFSPHRILVIRYEDFLSDSVTYLKRISQFINVQFSPARIRGIVDGIDPDRAYAFIEDDESRAFYNKKREHRLMQRFYQDIPC
jgi:hypothetical protein